MLVGCHYRWQCIVSMNSAPLDSLLRRTFDRAPLPSGSLKQYFRHSLSYVSWFLFCLIFLQKSTVSQLEILIWSHLKCRIAQFIASKGFYVVSIPLVDDWMNIGGGVEWKDITFVTECFAAFKKDKPPLPTPLSLLLSRSISLSLSLPLWVFESLYLCSHVCLHFSRLQKRARLWMDCVS